MANGFFERADDGNMSIKLKLQSALAVTLALTGAAMAGNTTTTSTMRITVNVVPTVQMPSSAQEDSGLIAFGNDAQLHLRTQPSGPAIEERVLLAEKTADQRANQFAASDPDSRSILIRKTY